MPVQRINMQRMRAQLVLHEGLHLMPYRCTAGKLTIGVGYNIDAHGPPFGMTMKALMLFGITERQATDLLDVQIQTFADELDKAVPWWRDHDEIRMRVLLDMAFMGVGNEKKGLLSFRNTLASMQAKNYDAAADGMMDSKWARDVKTRAPRLAAMMRTGKDSTDF